MPPGAEVPVLDPIRSELVLNLVVTCSSPGRMGENTTSNDGTRDLFWPIVGGRFWGPKISGKVIPGGADYPVRRPDGVLVIDAFYRLQADDGTNILIHNKGIEIEKGEDGRRVFRLFPTFTTVEGPHDWLMKGMFVATLVLADTMPEDMKLARPELGENDRLIQVHRLF